MRQVIRAGSIFAVILTVLCSTALIVSCVGPAPQPPAAKIEPKTDTIHGDVRVDNYYWLKDRGTSEVTAYLEAENLYTEEVMKHTKDLQEKLFQEMRGRIKETDLSVPTRKDSFYYYSRTEEGKQYSIYCRKKGNLEASEEIILDQNQMAQGYGFFGLGVYSVSPDHRLLAYAVDTSGSESYTLFVKDLTTGTMLGDTIPDIMGPAEWAADNKTLFYTTYDEIRRPDKLWRHELGTSRTDDALIYDEKDQRFMAGIGKSLSEEYLFLELYSNNSAEVRFLRADNPTGAFEILLPRKDEVEYSVYHHGAEFYVLTNDNAENFKVLKTSIQAAGQRTWEPVIEHRDSVLIENLYLFENHMAALERENGLRQLRVIDLRDGRSHYVEFPEPIYLIAPSGNAEYKTNLLRFTYTSLVTPMSIYDYDMISQQRELLKQYEVLGGYKPEDYSSERIFARAPDGILVPISMVYKKGLQKDGSHPCYLYGYGAYGYSMEPYFSSSRLSLLDRGFVFAIAHVRGGSELGRWWYEDGRRLKKMNTFTDFISCGEQLIAEKYTSADKLVISGASAGGLTVGAVLTLRPDLCRVVIADVPFVDVINTMLDSTIPLTVNEYTEWGNPGEKEYYDYMLKYSPYDNVRATAYPNILVTGGLNDPNVQYWEPAKFTAKLRALKTDQNRLLLKTNMGAGHGGPSGRYDYLRDTAFEYAFVLDVMGIRD